MKFLTLSMMYLGFTFLILYFFSSANYIDSCGCVEYNQNIDKFYEDLKINLSNNSKKINKLFNKNSYIAAYYRHMVCGKYLKNTNKMLDIGFSQNDIEFYQENLLTTYETRGIMFTQSSMSFVCFMIANVMILVNI